MRKLLTASLLLSGCALQPALAQQATTTPVKTQAAEPIQVPDWVAAEFGEAYGRYFPELPSFYQYTASQALRNTPLAIPNANLTTTLAQNTALREAVYQTVYQYCHALKYGLGNRHEVDQLVYLMLYQDLHLSDLAATRLAPYILSRYQQPAPPILGLAGSNGMLTSSGAHLGPIDEQGDRNGSLDANYSAPRSGSRTGSGGGLEMSGWRFDSTPVVEAVDDNPGVIRFKMKITDKGEVDYVTKVSGNVSPAQERLCRDKLLEAHFVKTNAGAGGASGFYTFRFSIR
jgi:hypothetical protein